MPTYKYTLTDTTNGTTSVQFNISPDFTAGVMAGGSVTVTGRVRNSSYAIAMVEGVINTTSTGGVTSNYGYFFTQVNPPRAAANTWVPFSMTLTKHASGTTIPSGTQAVANCYLHVNVQVYDSLSRIVYITPSSTHKFTIFNWHTSAHIADGSGIVRCDGNGIQRPDGNRLRFENFRVLTHSGSTLNKITFQVIQSGASSGSSYSVPSGGVTIAKLTSSPYTEATPSFFPTTLTLSSAYSYTILISFTDAYETTQQSIGIPRGAPILDFSLAEKGGLAVGQYSSSTDTEPRFEVAYPTYLAGGLVLTPGETRDTKSGQLMMTGIRFGRHKFSKAVAANGKVDEIITLSPSFNTDKYIVLLTPIGEGYIDCLYKTIEQYTSSFKIRYRNNAGASITPIMAWLAIEGSTDDSTDLTEGGGPSYPENILRGTGTLKTPVTDRTGTYTSGTWYKSGSGVSAATVSVISVSGGVDPGITQAFSIRSSSTLGNLDLGQYPVPLTSGTTYTASFWAKVPSGTTTLEGYLYDRTASKSTDFITGQTVSSTSWQHFHATVTFTGDGSNASIHFGLKSSTALDLCGFKLEKGTNSNPTWTPNPQD